LSIVVTHRVISSDIVVCTLCATFPSGLPRGSIVLDGFVRNPLRYEPGSTKEEEISQRYNQQMVPFPAGTAWD
jgi:hypothetical protein